MTVQKAPAHTGFGMFGDVQRFKALSGMAFTYSNNTAGFSLGSQWHGKLSRSGGQETHLTPGKAFDSLSSLI